MRRGRAKWTAGPAQEGRAGEREWRGEQEPGQEADPGLTQASDCAPWTRISTTVKCEGMRLLLHFPWVLRLLSGERGAEGMQSRLLESTQERDVQAWRPSGGQSRVGGWAPR